MCTLHSLTCVYVETIPAYEKIVVILWNTKESKQSIPKNVKSGNGLPATFISNYASPAYQSLRVKWERR